MFEKMLLVVDESVPSARAVPATAALAKRFHGEVVVVELEEHEPEVAVPEEWPSRPLYASLVDRVVMDLKDCGVSARPEIWGLPAADPARHLAELARHESADLIVLGWDDQTSGGDLSSQVLELTHRPVLAVP